MSIIDLQKRITDDWDIFQEHKHSSDSYMYISPKTQELDTSTVINLTIGDTYFNTRGEEKEVTGNGFTIRSGEYLLVETAERLSLPLNMFGIIHGKGHMIIQGMMVSAGKIEPGFNDKLKIGLLNSSVQNILLQKGDPFVSCYFINMETTLKIQPRGFDVTKRLTPSKNVKWKTTVKWLKDNSIGILTTLIALAAILVSIFN